jgi:DNA-binding Lrp family transcriptional regulator
MAPSNFAVIKRRLIEKGILQEEIRVNPHMLPGAKIAAFVWIDFNQPVRASLREELGAARQSFPTSVTYAAPDWSLNIDYFKSFEDAENARLRLAEILRSKAKGYVSEYMWKMVPLSHLSICHMKRRFIEYSMSGRVLHVDSGGASDAWEAEYPLDEPPAKLNETERKAVIAFRKYPNMSKSEIAKKIGIQQSSLSEVFASLRRKGVVSYVRTFDPSKLPGKTAASFALMEFKQPLIGSEVTRVISEVLNKTPQLTRVNYTQMFLLSVGFFSSLDSVENAHLTMLRTLGDNVRSFNFKIVPCSHLETVYSPYFLEQILGASA